MKRHALFVGVNAYDDKSIRSLRYSVPDATVLEDRFHRLGFKTSLLPDPTRQQLLSAVETATEGLGPGDVFLFFFAGHGFTARDGAHLLFCRDDRKRMLRVSSAGVRVDALELLTDGGGFHRTFLLDSCRTDCFADEDGRGEETRDLDFIAMPENSNETGTFFLLRSCDKFRPAIEIPGFGHGLFTQGLLDAIDGSDPGLARCGDDFAEAIRNRMETLARRAGVTSRQRPVAEINGPAFSLFDEGFFTSAPAIVAQKPSPATFIVQALVICPICGKKNRPEDTFKCRECGRDNLCLRHQDEETFLCNDCAARKMREAEAAHTATEAASYNARGEDFYNGRNGYPQDYTEAVKWFRKGAEQGSAVAQCNLGSMYYNGTGVHQDYTEAVKCIRKAAEQGDARAQCNLSVMFGNGHGVPKDYAEAVKWCRKAAEQEEAFGQSHLGDMYFLGWGVPQDDAEAVKWYRKAAEQGNENATKALQRRGITI